ncbi:hypothetical protein LSH36_151g07042 [Paralvinella palmiformis]|uniref:Endonuclease/exonuclease/phosphatase domain-containing protein n=1 Tax=Paralvinella palmiformis TaxID=53620 RepID=A0AAD9JW55_9ANNE|nr:hypothetical protein LSH36_151g07042 [Paralvinella palmiformis]
MFVCNMGLENLRCYSLNVRGMKSDQKRNKRIRYLYLTHSNQNTPSIIVMQETQNTIEVDTMWDGKSSSRVSPQEENKWQFNDGRYIIPKIECCSSKYVLTDVHAPTQDEENEQIILIDTLQNKLVIFEGENIIIGGDFNIPLDPKVDKK